MACIEGLSKTGHRNPANKKGELMNLNLSSSRCLSVYRVCLAIATMFLCFGSAATAEQKVFDLDAAKTTVSFTLGDVLHTVHGTFHLKRGNIRFDDSTGQASGELVVDATSGDSGSKARDSKMNKEILESQKFPEIIFTPQRFKGVLARSGKSHLEVDGQFNIHGEGHPMTLAIDADFGSDATANTSFDVPYVKWGMKNPSTFILRVNDKVQISIHAVARVTNAQKSATTSQTAASR
jgi:polyisoprenoid-binding protein YceI